MNVLSQAVSDAGQGGQVVLSADTFYRCNMEALADVRIFCLGSYQLGDRFDSVELFGATKVRRSFSASSFKTESSSLSFCLRALVLLMRLIFWLVIF
jgi:hypothetical protein